MWEVILKEVHPLKQHKQFISVGLVYFHKITP